MAEIKSNQKSYSLYFTHSVRKNVANMEFISTSTIEQDGNFTIGTGYDVLIEDLWKTVQSTFSAKTTEVLELTKKLSGEDQKTKQSEMWGKVRQGFDIVKQSGLVINRLMSIAGLKFLPEVYISICLIVAAPLNRLIRSTASVST